MSTITTITVKLPKSVHQKVLEYVIRDGYGMRGKSKWVSEAIEKLFTLPNYPDLVEIANEVEELTETISLRITTELQAKLDQAVIAVRRQYPAMEGVKSRIVRACIFQRLLRG